MSNQEGCWSVRAPCYSFFASIIIAVKILGRVTIKTGFKPKYVAFSKYTPMKLLDCFDESPES